MKKKLHQKIALKYKLIDNELPYYQYKPLSVLENSAAKLYWDRPILTDRTIPANRPDIVLVDHSKNTTYIVDVTIPHDENLQKGERDKILKYMDLAHEIKDMWRTPATIVVPIVISTNGLIPKSLHANLCKVGVGDGGLKYLMQKAVLLSTCRTLRCGIDFSKKGAFRRNWSHLSSDYQLPSYPTAKHESTPPKLIKLGEGIELLEEQIRAVKWADYRKLTRSLAALLFSPAELATCSVTGQRWSRAGLEERPTKPPLDRRKVQAIISYVSHRFPLVEVSRIKQVLAYKCKENCTALRMKSVSDNTNQQSGSGGLDGGCTTSDIFNAKH